MVHMHAQVRAGPGPGAGPGLPPETQSALRREAGVPESLMSKEPLGRHLQTGRCPPPHPCALVGRAHQQWLRPGLERGEAGVGGGRYYGELGP